ncbi:MAG: DUF2235 domain-containing protein [Paracoccaceae bacterium]
MADPAAIPKKIVLFADGTGNAFTTQESNVWRLYLALDKTGTDTAQIARYVPGVGTSSWRLVRALDGATGFGVPSNVRHLYRFLCMNWSPGDEIHLFGFSRGAFTVRTLGGMIRMQGLMPREIAENGVRRSLTEAEMDRAVMGAWLAYRAETAPLWRKGEGIKMNPLIAVVRGLRDSFIRVKRAVLGQLAQKTVTDQQPEAWRRDQVKIRFMGLFDTVEAYGVPFDRMRRYINWWVWPIVFRNRQCSAIVRDVRHALALDDTRLTFHPVQFDLTPRDPAPDVHERWFAGMHSDVGGGYPDDACAMAPLAWMAEEAAVAGLQFDAHQMQAHARRGFVAGPIHDSRQGFGLIYRYAPRMRLHSEGTGAPPVVDGSVLTKMRIGVDGYAPLTLPPDMQIAGGAGHGMQHHIASAATVAGLVSWRKATNTATLLCLAGFAFIAATPLWQDYVPPPDPPFVAMVKSAIGQLVPSYGARVILAFQAHWQTVLVLLGMIVGLHLINQQLARGIRTAARQIWRPLQPPDQGG